MTTQYQTLDPHCLQTLFPSRDRHANKGDFGHVLVIGGDTGMGGAVRLAAEAALRVGAGRVSVATQGAHIALVSGARPEIMCYAITAKTDISPLLSRATAVVIGPGLGKSSWSKMLFESVKDITQPMVIDADALNLLSEQEQKIINHHSILTPHPGEAARLLKCNVESVQTNRLTSINKLVELYGNTVVLKGADTLIATINEIPALCPFGNPGMASAGMGDVLSGVIAGLLAQQFSLFSAAKIGVLLHALAGDKAAKKQGERGLLAMDLMIPIHQLVNP